MKNTVNISLQDENKNRTETVLRILRRNGTELTEVKNCELVNLVLLARSLTYCNALWLVFGINCAECYQISE